MELVANDINTKTGEIAERTNWDVMKSQAETLLKSGFLPPALNTVEKILTVALKGKELNIPMMEACASIAVIQGRPSVSPQLMLALARRTRELEDMVMDIQFTRATVSIKRKGQSPYATTFGEDEAKAMGLFGKDNYKKQPQVMYQWRALAANLRVTFPDAISGLYTFDEMGATMDIEGNLQSVQTPIIEMPKKIKTKTEVVK